MLKKVFQEKLYSKNHHLMEQDYKNGPHHNLLDTFVFEVYSIAAASAKANATHHIMPSVNLELIIIVYAMLVVSIFTPHIHE